MDWIEKLTGISPDGGDGSTEMMLVVGLVLVLAAGAAVTWRRRRARRAK